MKQINEVKRMQQLAGILKENMEMEEIDFESQLKNNIENAINTEYENIHGKVFAGGVKEYANMYVDEGKYLKYSGMNIDEITQKLIEDAENEISAEMESSDIDNPFEDPNY